MKKIIVLTAFFITVSALCAQGPQIEFQEDSVNFGRVAKQTTVKHVFKFKNSGDSVLYINDIVAGCSCTGTLVSDKSVQPGATGELEVNLYTGKVEMKLFKSVYVYSNDPKNGIVILNMTAFVDIDPSK